MKAALSFWDSHWWARPSIQGSPWQTWKQSWFSRVHRCSFWWSHTRVSAEIWAAYRVYLQSQDVSHFSGWFQSSCHESKARVQSPSHSCELRQLRKSSLLSDWDTIDGSCKYTRQHTHTHTHTAFAVFISWFMYVQQHICVQCQKKTEAPTPLGPSHTGGDFFARQ